MQNSRLRQPSTVLLYKWIALTTNKFACAYPEALRSVLSGLWQPMTVQFIFFNIRLKLDPLIGSVHHLRSQPQGGRIAATPSETYCPFGREEDKFCSKVEVRHDTSGNCVFDPTKLCTSVTNGVVCSLKKLLVWPGPHSWARTILVRGNRKNNKATKQ